MVPSGPARLLPSSALHPRHPGGALEAPPQMLRANWSLQFSAFSDQQVCWCQEPEAMGGSIWGTLASTLL